MPGYAIRAQKAVQNHFIMQAALGPPLKLLGVLLEVLGPNGIVDVILGVPTGLPLKAPGQQVRVVHVAQQVCSRVAGASEMQGRHQSIVAVQTGVPPT